MTEGSNPFDTVAAVDLGSNSFHLIVARPRDGDLQILDRLREMVRLASGLDEKNQLSSEARERALECLARFGQRLRNLPPGSVRIVGTNTLRKARGSDEFIAEAEELLGHPIEVIAGREEARLIYLGVSHSLAEAGGRHLVVDIGGGSTELITGERFEPREMESLYMGCVSYSRRFFTDGVVSAEAWARARTAALLELRGVRSLYRKGWQDAVGASGTIKAVGAIANAMGWCAQGISREALDKLGAALVEAGHVDKLQLDGLKPERLPVIAGGTAVLSAIFEALEIEQMQVSDWALREGLIYDLMGRISHEDVRERTIGALMSRFDVDVEQAELVEATALELHRRVAADWGLADEAAAEDLGWAARTHELGLAVAHGGYHKHGAYLLENADLAGFSRNEQQLLALLVRGHRRKLPMTELKALSKPLRERSLRLLLLLRLAVLLRRGRGGEALPEFSVKASDDGLEIHFEEGWLDGRPLNRADLEREAGYWKAGKMGLGFS